MPTCKFENCNKFPKYGYIGGLKEYCGYHKLEGMIDNKSILCSFDGCYIRAGYGYKIIKQNFVFLINWRE